jgi:hypothetical protein
MAARNSQRFGTSHVDVSAERLGNEVGTTAGLIKSKHVPKAEIHDSTEDGAKLKAKFWFDFLQVGVDETFTIFERFQHLFVHWDAIPFSRWDLIPSLTEHLSNYELCEVLLIDRNGILRDDDA